MLRCNCSDILSGGSDGEKHNLKTSVAVFFFFVLAQCAHVGETDEKPITEQGKSL